jgi:hypothetical protein
MFLFAHGVEFSVGTHGTAMSGAIQSLCRPPEFRSPSRSAPPLHLIPQPVQTMRGPQGRHRDVVRPAISTG